MNDEQFREIEAALDMTKHNEFALALGMSHVSVKRMATGKQDISDQTARLAVALLVLHKEGLEKNFQKELAKYHGDT